MENIFSFLPIIGEGNLKVQEYQNSFIGTWYINPTMVANILVNYEDYCINDIKKVVYCHTLFNDKLSIRKS